jgi:hypothetical protein
MNERITRSFLPGHYDRWLTSHERRGAVLLARRLGSVAAAAYLYGQRPNMISRWRLYLDMPDCRVAPLYRTGAVVTGDERRVVEAAPGVWEHPCTQRPRLARRAA